MTMDRAKLTAVVLSYNRAEIIGTCLRALSFADEVLVVDKSSSDGATSIAAGLADRIISVPWSPTVEESRAYAVSECTHDWILYLDDDECLSVEAARFIEHELEAPRADIYLLPSRHYILGVHDERAYYWPEHQPRFFRRDAIAFTPTVHDGVSFRSERVFLVPIESRVCLHHLSHRDVAQWLDKTNRYTSQPDRDRVADECQSLAEFAHARLDHWMGRSGGEGTGYTAAVALLRTIYDLVDRLKTWEGEQGLGSDDAFSEICRALEIEYALKLKPPRCRNTEVVGTANRLALETDPASREIEALREALYRARGALESLREDTRREAEILRGVLGQEQASARRRESELRGQVRELAGKLERIESSTVWRSIEPVRRFADRNPRVFGHVRRAVRLAGRAARVTRGRVQPAGIIDPAPQLDRQPLMVQAFVPANFRVPRHEQPEVSVVIPTYGKVDHTVRCLGAIAAYPPKARTEVIVADDASADPNLAQLKSIPGLVLRLEKENMGFLRNCNRAAKSARGELLLFLNNDTQVQPGWLDSMLALMRNRPDTGAVGSKLLYPDGTLQEAGGIIWSDGSGWNYGRGDDPEKPWFNYVREADYCSGASLLVRRQVFNELGGFDERYAPAYFEDSDLAFRLREQGLKVLYQPASQVIHFEGVSHGTDVTSGVKAHQITNQTIFNERWGKVLARDHVAPGGSVLRARDRAKTRPVLLIVDHLVPEPDRDAGSRTMYCFVRALLEAGLVVKFWPDNLNQTPGYTEALQELGVEVFYGPLTPRFSEWIAEEGAALDYVMLSRPTVAAGYIDAVRQHSAAKVIYYGHDLHFARLQAQAAVKGDPAMQAEADRMQVTERALWRRADVVLHPSDDEAAEVLRLEPDVLSRSVVPYCFDVFAPEREPPPDAGMIMVGGFAHPPNEDAVLWLVGEVLPLVRRRVPSAHLWIAGSHPTGRIKALQSEWISLAPNVPEAELRGLYAKARVAVVPLRFGAGIKLKMVEALREGVPAVSTPVGAQGLPLVERAAVVASEASAFADAVCDLLQDDALWRRQSANALAYARHRFSVGALTESLFQASGIRVDRRL
ncbi:MAG: glycosyltransferase [Acetobacteraceae bacterium]|nr:glycosyltransferase [Acetobacteraceae bacterium]